LSKDPKLLRQSCNHQKNQNSIEITFLGIDSMILLREWRLRMTKKEANPSRKMHTNIKKYQNQKRYKKKRANQYSKDPN